MTDLLITLTAHERDSNNVTIAFTMGLKALEKGSTTEIILLSDAVHLAENRYADKIDIGEPFRPVKDLIPEFIGNGGKLKVCKSCLVHNKVNMDNLIEGSLVIEAGDVIDALLDSKKSLQLN